MPRTVNKQTLQGEKWSWAVPALWTHSDLHGKYLITIHLLFHLKLNHPLSYLTKYCMQWNTYTILQKVCLRASQRVTAPYPEPQHQRDPVSAVTARHRPSEENSTWLYPFLEKKKKTKPNKNRLNWACTERAVLPSKQPKACAHGGIFQCTLHISLLKMLWFCSHGKLHAPSRRRISTFSPQLANWKVFSNTGMLTKK